MPSDVLEVVNSEDEREVYTSLVCPHTSFAQLPRLHGAASSYVCRILQGPWRDRSTGVFPLPVLLYCRRLSIGPWDDFVIVQDVWHPAPFTEDPAHLAAVPMLAPVPFTGVNEMRRGWRHADDPGSSMLDASHAAHADAVLSVVPDAAPGRPGHREGGVFTGVHPGRPLFDNMLELANVHAVDTVVPWGARESFPPFADMESREHTAHNAPVPGMEPLWAPDHPQQSSAQVTRLLSRLPAAAHAEAPVLLDPTQQNDCSHILISSGRRDDRSPRVSVPENVAQGADGTAQPPVLAPSLPRPALGSFSASSFTARNAVPIAPVIPRMCKFDCEECSHSLADSSTREIRSHLEAYHGYLLVSNENGKVVCHWRTGGTGRCGKELLGIHGLVKHIATVHLETFAVTCPHCEMRCSRKDALDRHIEHNCTVAKSKTCVKVSVAMADGC